jgi:uncharacterized protein with PQ loop repeat
MNNALHHQHLRKRLYTNLEPFPHPNRGKRVLDRTVYVIGVLGPLSTIPQVYIIFAHHNASGVSALSWSIYFLFSTIWLVYGIVHKEKVLIVTYSLWIVMNALVALGALIY